jgi:hypothetical protein
MNSALFMVAPFDSRLVESPCPENTAGLIVQASKVTEYC